MLDALFDDERDSEGYYRCRVGCGFVYKIKVITNRLLIYYFVLVILFYNLKYRNLFFVCFIIIFLYVKYII